MHISCMDLSSDDRIGELVIFMLLMLIPKMYNVTVKTILV